VKSEVKLREFEVRKKFSIFRKRGWNVISAVKWRDFEVWVNQEYTWRRLVNC
jgi:hypothetical protein